MKKVYFIRHGESEANVAKVISSRSESPLTERGRKQADKVGKQVKDQNITIDLMLVSPLLRTRQTADIISESAKPLARESYDDILERDLSPAEGESYAMYENFLDFENYLDDIPGVEPVEEMLERAKRVMQYVQDRPEETIVLVSHGSFGMSLLQAANHPDLDTIQYIDNCSILRVI